MRISFKIVFPILLFSVICSYAGTGGDAASAADDMVRPGRMVDEFNSIANLESAFPLDGTWMPYPPYSDRKAWDELSGPFKSQIIAYGNKYLDYRWELQSATSYLDFEKNGNRTLMHPEERNRAAMAALLTAEMVEGKGRYMRQIVDGVYLLCQQNSWSHGKHTSMQSSKRTLPTRDEAVVSLHGAATGAILSFVYHFLHEEFDRFDPSISSGLKREILRQVVTPYEDRTKDGLHWWKRAGSNWNVFCNHNALVCILLMEDNHERMIRTLRHLCESVDIYMNSFKQDGACEEGPAYWGMSCGTFYELLKVMQYASGGKFDLFDEDLVRRMGEFECNTWFDGGWVMNYGDGGARVIADAPMLFRFGQDCGSRKLMDFAVLQLADSQNKTFTLPRAIPEGLRGMAFRSFETMKSYRDLQKYEQEALAAAGGDFDRMMKNLRGWLGSETYPQTEYSIYRKGDWALAAKGGNNGENHGHNDVGSAVLYVKGFPVLVDPGTGTYTKDTFGPNRYSVWSIGSYWHNVPVINGCLQHDGKEFKANNVKFDIDRTVFSADIGKAYPEESACRAWTRTFQLTDASLTITDSRVLSERKAADELHFVVRGSVRQEKPGEIIITAYDFGMKKSSEFIMTYSPSLSFSVEEKQYPDATMIRNWGTDRLNCIILKSADNAPLKGKYVVKVIENK